MALWIEKGLAGQRRTQWVMDNVGQRFPDTWRFRKRFFYIWWLSPLSIVDFELVIELKIYLLRMIRSDTYWYENCLFCNINFRHCFHQQMHSKSLPLHSMEAPIHLECWTPCSWSLVSGTWVFQQLCEWGVQVCVCLAFSQGNHAAEAFSFLPF